MCTVKVHHIAELVVWCLLSRYWRLAVVARSVQWRCTTVQSYSCDVCCTGTGGHSHSTKVCAVKVCRTAELFMWHLLYRYWRPATVPRCLQWRYAALQSYLCDICCTGTGGQPRYQGVYPGGTQQGSTEYISAQDDDCHHFRWLHLLPLPTHQEGQDVQNVCQQIGAGSEFMHDLHE